MLEEEEKLSFLFLLLPGRLVILLSSLLFLSFLVRGSTDFSDFTAPDSCAMMQRLPGKQVTDAEHDIYIIMKIMVNMTRMMVLTSPPPVLGPGDSRYIALLAPSTLSSHCRYLYLYLYLCLYLLKIISGILIRTKIEVCQTFDI